ncbi:MAG: hypothetical protein WC054_08105 [Candidatus Nanopelagicales bacterium]
MVCEGCDKQLPTPTKFCTVCGTKVAAESNDETKVQNAPTQVRATDALTQALAADGPTSSRRKGIIGAVVVAVLFVGFGWFLGTRQGTDTEGAGPAVAATAGASRAPVPGPSATTTLAGTWVGYSSSGGTRIRQSATLSEDSAGALTGTLESVSESGKNATSRLVGTQSGSSVQLDQVEWLTAKPDGWWLATLRMDVSGDRLEGTFSRLGQTDPEGLVELARTSPTG